MLSEIFSIHRTLQKVQNAENSLKSFNHKYSALCAKSPLISQRTIEGLARAKRDGKKLGRPKGALGKSKLDGKEAEIKQLLEKASVSCKSRRQKT